MENSNQTPEDTLHNNNQAPLVRVITNEGEASALDLDPTPSGPPPHVALVSPETIGSGLQRTYHYHPNMTYQPQPNDQGHYEQYLTFTAEMRGEHPSPESSE